MNKVPVFETIAHAYGFAFGKFFRILGIIWAPTMIVLALSLLSNPVFFGHVLATDPDAMMRQTVRLAPLTLAVTLLVRGMMATGVTELALGTHKGPSFVYFSLGGAVWRFIGAWLLTILVMFVLVIGLIITLAIAGVIAGFAMKAGGADPSKMAIAGIVALCILFFYAVMIYVTARLTVFIPPVVVAEGDVNLARGWQLSKGNFWRIFAVGLGIFLPLLIILFALFLMVYGSLVSQEFMNIVAIARDHASSDVVQQHIQQSSDAFGAKVSAMALSVFPYTVAYTLLAETIGYGLGYGASVFAYRAITETPAADSMQSTMA